MCEVDNYSLHRGKSPYQFFVFSHPTSTQIYAYNIYTYFHIYRQVHFHTYLCTHTHTNHMLTHKTGHRSKSKSNCHESHCHRGNSGQLHAEHILLYRWCFFPLCATHRHDQLSATIIPALISQVDQSTGVCRFDCSRS